MLKCSLKVVRGRTSNPPFHFSYPTAATCSSAVWKWCAAEPQTFLTCSSAVWKWRAANPQTFLFIFRIPPQLRAQVLFECGAWPNLKPSFSFFVSHRSYVLKCSLKVAHGQTSNLPFHFLYHTAATCSSASWKWCAAKPQTFLTCSSAVGKWCAAEYQTFLFIFHITPQLRAQVQFESGARPNLKPSSHCIHWCQLPALPASSNLFICLHTAATCSSASWKWCVAEPQTCPWSSPWLTDWRSTTSPLGLASWMGCWRTFVPP